MHRTSGNNALCFESLEKALAGHPETYGHLDLIAFGFPCQDISNANPKGKGLKGERSNLFFEAMRIVNILTPKWLLIENVPRLLSINEGRDFATVLQTLSESGYGYSWRILDTQYFGCPQRRKRVFIIGCFGNICPPEILFEQKGGGRDDKKKPEIRERGLCLHTPRGRCDPSVETYIAYPVGTIDGSNGTKGGGTNLIAQTLRKSAEFNSATGGGGGNLIASTIGSTPRGNSSFIWQDTHIAETNPDRKREIARIPEKFYSDSQRGIVIGNAVSVPVAEWIGKRIEKYGIRNK